MTERRRFLAFAAVLPFWGVAQASSASVVENALTTLGVRHWHSSRELILEMPDVAENGALVPLEVSSAPAGTRRIILIAEGNPVPLLADFRFEDGALPWLEARIKLAESSHVAAYAEVSGQWYQARRFVRVIAGGCGQG